MSQKPFPIHCLSKILNVNRIFLQNRLPRTTLDYFQDKAEIEIDFKILKFSPPIDAERIRYEERLWTESPNGLIKKMITRLFEEYDKKLLLNKSEIDMFALKVGEKDQYLAGEEPLYCYEELVTTHLLKKKINLTLVELNRRVACDYPYSMVFSSQIGKYDPSIDLLSEDPSRSATLKSNILIWQFPIGYRVKPSYNRIESNDDDTMNENKPKDEFTEDEMRKIEILHQIRSERILSNLQDVFSSSSIRSSYSFKVIKIVNAHKLFKETDFKREFVEELKIGFMNVAYVY